MTLPKLSYFDFPGGRGEDARLAYFIANVPFTDDRIPGATWPERKCEFAFGCLPALEVPGKGTITQSNAILTYIGRTNGLHPSDPFTAARHEALMGAVEDFRAKLDPTMFAPDDVKKAARAPIAETYAPRWAAAVAPEIKGPFVEGDTLNVVDLKLAVFVRGFLAGRIDYIPGSIFEAQPALVRLCEAVAAHPRVAAWYAKG